MSGFFSGILDRVLVFLFLLVVLIISIFSPKMAVKVIDDFSED